MTCREFADFLLSYAEGELAPAERAAFDGHLAICPDCVNYLAQYLDTIRAAPRAFRDDFFVEAPEDLVQAILASRVSSAG